MSSTSVIDIIVQLPSTQTLARVRTRVNRNIIRLWQSREALASWKYITIELEDGLPAALRDVYGPN